MPPWLADVVARAQEPVVLDGLGQVAAASVLAAVVLGLVRWQRLDLEAELGVAFARGFVQIVAMGLLIGGLLTLPLAWSGVILLGMVGGATWIAQGRGAGLPGVARASFVAIGVGAGTVVVLMTWAGAIEATVRSLVPVGSLVIANAMKVGGLALERFREEVTRRRAEIEVGLALGGPPDAVLADRVAASVRASLIPVVDALKSLGWVWIPGLMAGMILAGENPIYAALYQFVIMAMVFAAGGLTSLVSTLLLRRAVMTDAEQLRRVDAPDA